MKIHFKTAITAILLTSAGIGLSCTKLDQKVYSVTPNENFWQTPAQIAAGVAPAYQSLQSIPNGNVYNLNEVSSDEQIVPTRGGDWDDGGKWRQLWLHTWTPNTGVINDAWNDIFRGIGKINFILSVVNNLENPPADLDNINAELKTLRAYYYFLAMDLFGNVPLVTDFNVDPNSVTNSPRADIFNFVETELKDNLQLLTPNVDVSTYGRVTKYFSFSLLARLYLNAGVFTGTPRWNDCRSMCDSVILSGKYSLETNYFDNFAVKNDNSKENIFVVPFDNINIGGNNWEMATLHYQNQINFGLSGGPWNGFCSTADFYNSFDTSSVYTLKGNSVFRTFNDARTGQYLVGQQFTPLYTYPPNTNVMYSTTDDALVLKDAGTALPIKFDPNVPTISSSSDAFRLAGVRNIKYFPEQGTAGNQSNDMVIFRLADIYLMKAEASLRAGVDQANALDLVNQIRSRAYGGDASRNWTMADLTLNNLLAERGREMAWENTRRQDLIRYGTFGAARKPDKVADPADGTRNIYPIPAAQIIANPTLKQNPGY